ncbi:enoyl-CoA hydratase [Pollutimonas nitritireducens]|uniref:Enoyl-CoA hydratase n=1 Tax=Pollutimonas nitritireducens TaxID=2045209 RepID=A0A2N4UI03_9BURK|nr:enoyl-CoA hydratase-related protein [Pollutimonas nitritireducens]PLC54663.1 enoyl-CoA hydratase [Pollutimonas nitritireducens]
MSLVDQHYDTIELARPRAHVLQVTLNRPASGNAISTQMGHDLLNLWNRLTADSEDYRCVVLTGSGNRIFCAGGDLKERNGMSKSTWQRQHELFERMYWTLIDMPLPVIAAVNGHAYAGGLELALSCDFIYADLDVRFALTEVTLGIMPGAGGTQLLPRAVGQRRAKEILMTGAPFTAQQALEWGVVSQICDGSTAVERALDTAARIAENAPLSVRQIKKSVRYGGEMELRTALRFEVEAYNHLVDTEDRVEGVLAFNEKRKPIFQGK